MVTSANQENREYINIQNYYRFKDITMRRINDGISVYELHSGEKLITSDNPVFASKNIYDPSAIIRMPINNKYFVSIVPFDKEKLFDNKLIYRTKLDAEHSYVEAMVMNCSQIDQAEQFILGHNSDLEKALGQCKKPDIDDLQSRANKLLVQAEQRLKNTKADTTYKINVIINVTTPVLLSL